MAKRMLNKNVNPTITMEKVNTVIIFVLSVDPNVKSK